MKFILALIFCTTIVVASDFGGGHGIGHTVVKQQGFVLPIPEIGFSFDKLPLFLPIPVIRLGKRPTLISKPVALNLGHGFDLGGLFGGHGGHGGGFQIALGGHGGGLGLGGGHGLW